LTNLGVLTKADLLQEGQHENWLGILKNEKYRLVHGYYAAKLPGSAPQDTHQTWEQIKESEKRFFKKDPWNKLASVYGGKLGTDNLKEVLSKSLAKMIEEKYISLSVWHVLTADSQP
jgi:hypothetical protein